MPAGPIAGAEQWPEDRRVALAAAVSAAPLRFFLDMPTAEDRSVAESMALEPLAADSAVPPAAAAPFSRA